MAELEQPYRILVADDSAISRKLVEHALEGQHCSLQLAKSGSEALDLCVRHSPEIIVTDWMMPDFSGLELCQRIRADVQGGYTYIILLTSNSDKENIVQGLAAGADDYLTKPFDSSELLARIGVGRRIVQLHNEIAAKNRLLEEMAHTDPLTKLPNRRAIEDWTKKQLSGAERHAFSLWVVLADLDSFKTINDTYGHDAGDVVLQRFAEVLTSCTRTSDICGRLGGDEFLLVLTHVQEKDVQTTVDRFRRQMAVQEFRFGNKMVSTTASFGVAGFEADEGKSPEFSALVKQADKALYEAKRSGRNQVKVESLHREKQAETV